MPTTDVAIAILAAGSGTRFGGGKLLAPLAGRPLIRHAVDAAHQAQLGALLVVVSGDETRLGWGLPSDVVVVPNPLADEGIASSLRAALAWLEPRREIGAVCIGLGDQPLIGSESYRLLAAAHAGGATFAVATYAGERRNPVLIGRELWAEAMMLTGDQGARRLMSRHHVVEVACDGTGEPCDVDTANDLQEIEKRCSPTTAVP